MEETKDSRQPEPPAATPTPETSKPLTRRNILKTVPSAAALLIPPASWSQHAKTASPASAQPGLNLPVLTQPDLVFAYLGESEAARHPLQRTASSATGSN